MVTQLDQAQADAWALVEAWPGTREGAGGRYPPPFFFDGLSSSPVLAGSSSRPIPIFLRRKV